MISFESLGLSTTIIEGLKKQNITAPTDIQERAIPLALQNKDIVGQSQTGSGKTLTYLLPIFQKLNMEKREMQAIILAPTHELAMQIDKQIKLLSDNSGVSVTSSVIIGEVNVKRQIEKLREKPHIIIGSTGRIVELIKMRKITAHTIKTIVIDEGDRLLGQDSIEKVKELIKTAMRDTQLMVFSATITDSVLNQTKNILKNPEIIKIEDKELINPNIKHIYFLCEQRDKIELFRKLWASTKSEKAILFINKSDEVEITASKLQYHNINACGIHGSSSKEERQNAIEGFRSGKYKLLVASDLAARGLDIESVTHIFSLDLSRDSKEYLHRAGRTGRFGRSGTAISLVTKSEEAQIKKFEKEFNIEIKLKDIYMGKIIEPQKNPPAARPKSFKSSTNHNQSSSAYKKVYKTTYTKNE